ncbi:MAG TPA: choice-of-anchor tandem repeat GloVer-containing protein, partial [Rhizomicrobium sp.]|nr:choice-of-anchor tandem repeat GloVer-containing protein [Rhizomicrobium sp.]
GLTFDSTGDLYGMTEYGGSTNCGNGCGVLFKLSESGGVWNETLPHMFTGGSDGRYPLGGLAFDGAAMYGVTEYGGGSGCGSGCGIVFKMTLSPFNYATLYAFQNGNDGASPLNVTPLLADDGLLYGTAQGGGPFEGVVYSVTTTP